MNEPLRVAWLGHQSGRAGDGLLTYSRETVAGLRARGVKVFFVHHGALPAVLPYCYGLVRKAPLTAQAGVPQSALILRSEP